MEAEFSPALRQPAPQSIDAEQSILGCCLLDGTSESVEVMRSVLTARDFYRDAHRHIFEALCRLNDRDEPADLVTVGNELQRAEALDAVGGRVYLMACMEAIPGTSRAPHYAFMVREAANRRRLIDLGSEFIRMGYEEQLTPSADLLCTAQEAVCSLAETNDTRGPKPIREGVERRLARLEEAANAGQEFSGIATGFPQLDRITGGLQRGHVIIIAGRTSMGKSALALDFVSNAVNQGKRCLIFSQEMSDEQIAERLLAIKSGVDSIRLRNGQLRDGHGLNDEWVAVTHAAADISGWPLEVDDQPVITLAQARSRARRMKATRGLDLIVVDYLQLIARDAGRPEHLRHEIARLTKGFKNLAQELEIPVVALSQVSRAAERRDDKRPMLSDLAEASAIENDADLVLILYRPGYYKRGESDENAPDFEPAEVIVAKHRHGPQGGIIPLRFARRFGRFLPAEEEK